MKPKEALAIMCDRCGAHPTCCGTGCTPRSVLMQCIGAYDQGFLDGYKQANADDLETLNSLIDKEDYEEAPCCNS